MGFYCCFWSELLNNVNCLFKFILEYYYQHDKVSTVLLHCNFTLKSWCFLSVACAYLFLVRKRISNNLSLQITLEILKSRKCYNNGKLFRQFGFFQNAKPLYSFLWKELKTLKKSCSTLIVNTSNSFGRHSFAFWVKKNVLTCQFLEVCGIIWKVVQHITLQKFLWFALITSSKC